jgi:hypothetical protein
MSFVETALAFKSKLRVASPCGYYEGPEHECFRSCTSRPMGPTNPAFSRNSKPPPLGGGVFTIAATDQYTVWDTDSNGNYVSSATPSCSRPVLHSNPSSPASIRISMAMVSLGFHPPPAR